MNYTFPIDEYETEKKQHLNLSETAWLVIDEDIKNFYESKEKESFSGFINRIFQNYYQKSIGTINNRVLEKKEELQKLYSDKSFQSIDKKIVNQFIDKYLNVYKKQLIKKNLSYKTGEGKKFRLNKNSMEILKDSDEGENYEGNIGKYLKAILEDYALKPSYQREQIFFADIIDTIQKAINNKKKLKITLLEKVTIKGDKKYRNSYLVSPYFIEQDKTNSFNYLIGFGAKINEVITRNEDGNTQKSSKYEEIKPCCYRISRIAKINIQTSMGIGYSKDKENTLRELLIERGPMFLTDEIKSIKVRFTEKGLESFKRQIYMRPQFYEIDKEDKYLYTFECTEVQAINYFFKFGWDAVILEPERLAYNFKNRYERSLKAYNGMSKEEILASEKIKI